MSITILVGGDKVVIEGTPAFMAHMQGVVIEALQSAPIASARSAGKRDPRRHARGKNRGGRRRGSRVIDGKVYTAGQIRANPALLRKMKARGK
jgi:hypothetical protein